jgi:hypothetical protein
MIFCDSCNKESKKKAVNKSQSNGFVPMRWEIPRLCRGDSKSLTNAGFIGIDLRFVCLLTVDLSALPKPIYRDRNRVRESPMAGRPTAISTPIPIPIPTPMALFQRL